MDPQSEALRFRLRMTRDVSFPPPFCHSRENGNPDPTGSRIKRGMTGGDGSPIRSASLSVEDDWRDWIPHQARDDGRDWIPHQVRDDKKECGSPIRSASLSVEDDKGCIIPAPLSVIPVKTGIQSEWIPHQVRDDGRGWIPNPKRFAFG